MWGWGWVEGEESLSEQEFIYFKLFVFPQDSWGSHIAADGRK